MQLDPGTRLLGEEPAGDRARVAELDHELVGALRGTLARGKPEHAQRRLAVPEDDRLAALRHRLAGAEVERNSGPPPVVDLDLERDERLRRRALRHALARPGSPRTARARPAPARSASSPRTPCSSPTAAPSRRATSAAPSRRSRAPGTGA